MRSRHIVSPRRLMSTSIARRLVIGGLGMVGVASIACSPSSLIDVQSPSTVVDPTQVQTPSGVTQLRANALLYMVSAYGGGAYGSVITMSGTITDELQDPYYSGSSGDDRNVLNTRLDKNANGYGYDQIQQARVALRQALQGIQQYAADASSIPKAWQGELYALQGYTVVWFAELFCSGIPLSASSLNGSQTPTRGLTTGELLETATALFDSAIVAGADSSQYVYLARVGKARAQLALGNFAVADTVVQSVPTDFLYQIPAWVGGYNSIGIFDFPTDVASGTHRVMDNEGHNGLVWSTDPRTGVVTQSGSGAMLWPGKYNVNSSGTVDPMTPRSQPIRLADGLEARLIQAEAALARGDASWLTTLNMLRATCVGSAACAPRLGLASAQLPPLADPVVASARLDTLMKERAMWLYLTGHREGDMRRLARVYSRDPGTLWPKGLIMEPAYPDLFPNVGAENGAVYGPDMVYGPDVNEHIRNQQYSGCYDTNP